MMQLGNLEETVLLLVMIMEEEAYGYAVSKEYYRQNGKEISISAVHTVLSRLENKGLIKSEMGGTTEERGGRRKRIFKTTEFGVRTAQELKAHRTRLWNQLPQLQ
ncbi:MAG: PadR family transcriptional regulator [Bacteroidota bacterium]